MNDNTFLVSVCGSHFCDGKAEKKLCQNPQHGVEHQLGFDGCAQVGRVNSLKNTQRKKNVEDDFVKPADIPVVQQIAHLGKVSNCHVDEQRQHRIQADLKAFHTILLLLVGAGF